MKHVVFLEASPFSGPRAVQLVKQTLGYRVSFVTSNLNLYLKGQPIEKSPLRFADELIEVEDSTRFSALRPVISRLHQKFPIDALMTLHDLHVILTAELARSLNLRHLAPEVARRARHKITTRYLLQKAGVPQPQFRVVPSLAEAGQTARELGYPFIVKPADGTGSVNTKLVQTDAEMRRHFRAIKEYQSYLLGIPACGEVLFEEYVEGQLVSVETLTQNGRHHVLGITDRELGGFPNFVELGGSFPAEIDKPNEVMEVAKAALDAIGLDFGPAHTELVLSKTGPKIIEINPRLVGGFVPLMIDRTLNRNIVLDVVRLHLGEDVTFDSKPDGVATLQALYCGRSGVLRSVHQSPHAADSRVFLYHIDKKAGDTVPELQDDYGRLGCIGVWERTQQASKAFAKEIFKETRFVFLTLAMLVCFSQTGALAGCDEELEMMSHPWPKNFPVVQVRVARPTHGLKKIIEFYRDGLGLQVVGSFEKHSGYSGVMLGIPDKSYHLEFTECEHLDGACSPPSRDNLLVFYLSDQKALNDAVARITRLGYKSVPPENPYWGKQGVTIEDPDGWRIVLMNSSGI